jgi:hypothetical protein
MGTVFDVITVVCFVGLVVAFFRFTNQDTATLLQFLFSGIVLAVANQVGNAGSFYFAGALVAAGVGYACLNVRRQQ